MCCIGKTAESERERQTDRERIVKGKRKGINMYMRDRQTGRQADRQTDKQTDRQTPTVKAEGRKRD